MDDHVSPITDAATFLGLERSEGGARWRMEVAPGVATMGGFLFGGCALGATILAMEHEVDRPVVWATAQYLSFAHIGDALDVEVVPASVGKYTAQCRAVGRVGDREVLTVNAALGSRPSSWDGQWAVRPPAPPPGDCPPRHLRGSGESASIMDRLELRLVRGSQWDDLEGNPTGDGTASMWVRMPGLVTSAASLAVLGDYVPWGIAQSLGTWSIHSNSLDNTLRIARIVPTQWVLLDIRIHAVHAGFGHGLVHLWAEDGTLLATASQSAIIRSR